MSRSTTATISIYPLVALTALSIGCGRVGADPKGKVSDATSHGTEKSANTQNVSKVLAKHAAFEGKWAGEAIADAKRKYLLRLHFHPNNEVTSESGIVLGEQEYPGAACHYKYEVSETATDEGTILLTMHSKQIEGIERIMEEDKKPKTWKFKVRSPDAMQITAPVVQVTATFELRREK